MGDYGRADDRLVVIVLIVIEATGLAVLFLGTERAAIYCDAVKGRSVCVAASREFHAWALTFG